MEKTELKLRLEAVDSEEDSKRKAYIGVYPRRRGERRKFVR